MKNVEKARILMDIKGRSKKLMPEKVVAAAEEPSHPLHSQFCWDNTAAAHKYRIWQARQLIAEVLVLVSPPSGSSRFGTSGPAFVSLNIDRREGGYRAVAEVMSDDRLKKEMLSTALGELKAMQFRYDNLKELADVWDAARKIEEKNKINPALLAAAKKHRQRVA